ncbi:hypothetical protein PGT21_009082 [Puccinia graminis f. sp. tritici]|uniref:Uncharacterized protein n=1 Tax=Puccinia graminis f. sp. tritici TaxID=56615 RepID=A0A5B0P3X2_PUCGR|nr:hypothetical protein PGT21_009082 [Puccinia graminis f. sp. tritici]KAA1099100.1 hypothetical protein PGTUg99_018563 [Puccinia graminis f. sp. tritici]
MRSILAAVLLSLAIFRDVSVTAAHCDLTLSKCTCKDGSMITTPALNIPGKKTHPVVTCSKPGTRCYCQRKPQSIKNSGQI